MKRIRTIEPSEELLVDTGEFDSITVGVAGVSKSHGAAVSLIAQSECLADAIGEVFLCDRRGRT